MPRSRISGTRARTPFVLRRLSRGAPAPVDGLIAHSESAADVEGWTSNRRAWFRIALS
jgi:hypothetical protein